MAILRKRKPKVTGFNVLFVGLVCFYKANGGGRLVMLPDGRTPCSGIAKHAPFLFVKKSNQYTSSNSDYQSTLRQRGRVELPKCTMTISGVTDPGSCNTSQHDLFGLKLTSYDPSARIDPADANDVVRLWARNGKLEVFRLPRSIPAEKDVALVSRLQVTHSVQIEIVLSTGDWIRLPAGTEIALANLQRGAGSGSHYHIFAELVKGRRLKGNAPNESPTTVPVLKSDHPVFRLGTPVNDGGAQCGNQGCC